MMIERVSRQSMAVAGVIPVSTQRRSRKSSGVCRGAWLAVVLALVLFPLAGTSDAVINPSLQPRDLVERYDAVLACRIVKVDVEAQSLQLRVEKVVSGAFEPETITVTATPEAGLAPIMQVAEEQLVVAFAGRSSARRNRGSVLYYVTGAWFLAELEDETRPERWRLLGDPDRDVTADSNEIMYATFNGRAEELQRMARDLTLDRGYFPAKPFTGFGMTEIAKLDGRIRAVALHDVDDDGWLDMLACTDTETRLFLGGPEGFIDATEQWGLADVGGAPSLGLADVDADGQSDLLLGLRLFLQGDGRFREAEPVRDPSGAKLISASFAEIDGDGRPDVVVSREGAGLAVLLNSGESLPGFVDATERYLGSIQGFDPARSGSGHFEICDWNMDGRSDIAYLAGRGAILVQTEDDSFEAMPILSAFETFSTATAAFGPVVRRDRPGLSIGDENRKLLLQANADGLPVDVSRLANEYRELTDGLRGVIATDLNADGTVDVFGASMIRGVSFWLATNRGYGSYMLEMKYAGERILPEEFPAEAVMAGDVTRDGAEDLLIGGLDGRLVLFVNETLEHRPREVALGMIWDEQTQARTRVLAIRPVGPMGVVGSRLTLLDEQGETVALRFIGSNLGVGSGPPHETTLAVRDPGVYTLEVRFADGLTKRRTVEISAETPRRVAIEIRRETIPEERAP
ncbi:MAG: VCBS repeat-containing protein [Phycisphaeraceae bacterium]